jgi:hypothetical protein
MNPKINSALKSQYAMQSKERSDAELQGWLELDTWTVEEGLLLIAGIDPQAAVVKWDGWVSALGHKINKVRLLNARPLSEHPIFLAIPSPESPCISDEGHPGEFTVSWGVMPDAQEEAVKWEKLSILQALEEKLTHLNRLWISGQHGGQRYPAAYFIGWAEKKNIEIPWLSHAREMEWLPVSITSDEVDALSGVIPAWVPQARKIGEDWMRDEEKTNAKRPTLVAIAKYVEGELSNRGITGARGKFLDWETIKREALTGITGRKKGDNFKTAMGNPHRKKCSPIVKA